MHYQKPNLSEIWEETKNIFYEFDKVFIFYKQKQ